MAKIGRPRKVKTAQITIKDHELSNLISIIEHAIETHTEEYGVKPNYYGKMSYFMSLHCSLSEKYNDRFGGKDANS